MLSGTGMSTSRTPVVSKLIALVRGGTTRASYDAEMKRRSYEAEQRRAHQDRAYAIQEQAQGHSGEVARIGSLGLINATSPRLVLSYLNRDRSVRQQCKSEITMIPVEGRPNEWQTMFAMVCPKCVARGVPQGEAQMLIRDSHRKFTLDERFKGQVEVVEYHFPDGTAYRERVVIAGKVSVHDIVRCDNYNCDYACRIENSNVIEV